MTDDPTPPPIPAFQFDLDNPEPMLGTTDIAREFARLTGRKAPHIGAVRRLMMVGSHGVLIPTLMIGGRRLSSARAIRWFVEACTAAAARGRPRQPKAPEALRPMTAHERRVLERNGVV